MMTGELMSLAAWRTALIVEEEVQLNAQIKNDFIKIFSYSLNLHTYSLSFKPNSRKKIEKKLEF